MIWLCVLLWLIIGLIISSFVIVIDFKESTCTDSNDYVDNAVIVLFLIMTIIWPVTLLAIIYIDIIVPFIAFIIKKIIRMAENNDGC